MSGAETERAPRAVTAGILVVSLAVLMAQVLLTRIFSFTRTLSFSGATTRYLDRMVMRSPS